MDLLLGAGCLVGRGQVVDRDVRAVLGEAHGDRLPDPGGAAGHQDVLALQAGHPRAAQPRVNGGRVCDILPPSVSGVGLSSPACERGAYGLQRGAEHNVRGRLPHDRRRREPPRWALDPECREGEPWVPA